MRNDRAILSALLRQDLLSFIMKVFATIDGSQVYLHSWHIELIAAYLEMAFRRQITRLIITLPPRSLKSIAASVAFPAWALGQDPSLRFICASYSAELAYKFARDTRATIETDWYREAFPRTRVSRRKSSEQEFETTTNGHRMSTSVGGTMTGRGANFIVIDDPLKPQDAPSDAKRDTLKHWYDGTLYSRLDDKKCDVIIIISQRTHVDDLVAHALGKDEPWVHLNLPAIAETNERFELPDGRVFSRAPGEVLHPERESKEVLQRIKSTLGNYLFEAQYQQNPIPIDGALVKWDWFRRYADPPERTDGDLVTQSWDTASKADEIHDYSVCTTWLKRVKEHYLLDVKRVQLDYPHLKKLVVEMADRYRADAVLIEDKGSGTQLIQDLQNDGDVRPIGIVPQFDKVTRMYTQTAKLEAGYVLIPGTASWLDDFRTEILQFPNGRHDDQIDSLSQYLGWEAPEPIGDDAVFWACPSPFAQEWEATFGSSRY